MEKITDKNILCILLTVVLALFTIGNAFHSGNWVLGCETIFMWVVLFSFQPMSKIIDTKLLYPMAKIDYLPLFKQTVENRYLFVSFCAALLFSMVFDDTLNYIGRFVEDKEILDLFVVCLVFFTGALVSTSFYYLISKIRIEKLKTKGERVVAVVEDIKFINNKFYVTTKVLNPLTGEKQKLTSEVFVNSKDEIPIEFSVFFDKKNPNEYIFDIA